MYLNQFSVHVPEGHECSEGYVEIVHGRQFTLVLRNDRSKPCDAEVRLNGEVVGVWRIDACGKLTLERPANDQGRFTFYKTDSPEGQAIGARVGNDQNGLIQVRFRPGHYKYAWPYSHAPWSNPQFPRPVQPWDPWKPYHRDIFWGANSAEWSAANYEVTCSTNQNEALSRASLDYLNSSSGGTVANASIPFEGTIGLSGQSQQRFRDVQALDYDPTQEFTISLRLVGTTEDPSRPRPLRSSGNAVPPPIK